MAIERDDIEVSEADFIDQQAPVDSVDEDGPEPQATPPILVDEVDWREQQVEVPLVEEE